MGIRSAEGTVSFDQVNDLLRIAMVVVALGSLAALHAGRAAAAAGRPKILSIAVVGVVQPVATGKRPVVVVRARGATACAFRAQTLPFSSLYPVRTVPCASGYVRVMMAAVSNPYQAVTQLTYSVTVRGLGGDARKSVTIRLAAAQKRKPPPSPAPAPVPATPTPPPTVVSQSSNWSGYAIGTGPFTSVAGTFNVPNLTSAPAETLASEWVGIDGLSNSSLIQAGVGERYDPTTNLVYLHAWWEILPAAETPISMSVAPGDEISVTIAQESGTLWRISLTDDTNGQSFVTEQTYLGLANSAEWIVEAPTLASTSTTTQLGDYIPDVTFTGLNFNGPETSITEMEMVQGGVAVSVPSALTTNGFTVAYGDVPPSPP